MKNKSKVSNPTIEKVVSEILSQSDPSEIFGKEGIFQEIKKQIVNKILEKEMESHIGYEKHSKNEKESDNRRNGNYEKTLIDSEGHKLVVEVPRDREGEFEPQLIPKGVRRFEGFDDKVISLYARGMTIREIQGHLEELYATKVSSELISKVTDGILEEVTAWQNREDLIVYTSTKWEVANDERKHYKVVMSYKKLTAVEKAGLKDRHRGERDKRICDRIKEVLLYDDVYKLVEIAKILLLSHEGVRKHLEDYHRQEKLAPENGGSYSKLNNQQEAELIVHLEENNYVYARDIGLYIERQYGVIYTLSGVINLLHRLGFSYKKPKLIPGKIDLDKQEEFKLQYSLLKNNLAKDESMLLYG